MLDSNSGLLSVGGKNTKIKRQPMPVAQIDYFALTSRIKRRDDTDLLSEIQAELKNIDNEIKVDDMNSQMARFSQNIDILEYNP